MFEDFEQELYEEPDYNVWETNQVYLDNEGEDFDWYDMLNADADAEADRDA